MTEIIKEIKKYLNVLQDITIDNFVFRALTTMSFSLFMICAIVVGATTFAGKPIVCHGNPNGFTEAHCWLHGSRDLTGKFEIEQEKCIDPEDKDVTKNLYYQWVTLVLFCSAFTFKIPSLIWSSLENGLMKTFYDKQYKDNTIKRDPSNYMKAILNTSTLLKECKGPRSWDFTIYYIEFLLCQLLAIAIFAFNFHVTNVFLNYKFMWYGYDVIKYYRLENTLQTLNPMCNTFPTRVECNLKTISVSGGIDEFNDYCILIQNSVNAKIYLLLWFWFVTLFTFASLQVLLEIGVILLPSVRQFLSFQQIGYRMFYSSRAMYTNHEMSDRSWHV